jgi:hypothetical protein
VVFAKVQVRIVDGAEVLLVFGKVDMLQLIDLNIDDRTSVAIHEILAHVMYDITFHGFTRKSVIDAGEDLRSISEGDTIVFDLSSFLDE